MTKAILILILGVATAQGSTIDGGNVFSPAWFVPDSTTVFLGGLSSTDGQFSLFGSVLGGGNLACADNLPLGCQFGGVFSIQSTLPDASSFATSATAIIGGSLVGTVLLGCPATGCPDTSMSLEAQPVVIAGPGSYSVPFASSGQIQASTGVGQPLILDQAVTGIGMLNFSVSQSFPGWFVFNTNGPNNTNLQWSFASVPEPATIWPCLLALAVIWWQQSRRRWIRPT